MNKIKKLYRSVLRMHLNYINRKRLNNNSFSLIAINCVGGVVSYELGLRFNSPTVNLWFSSSDYLIFLKNLKYYLCECEMKHDVEESKAHGYPVGILDDIRVYFQHYLTFEQAYEKWIERAKRVDFENLYIVMVQRDGCTEKNIKEFNELGFEHKVIFTSKEYPEFESAFHIHNSELGINEVKNLCEYQGKFTGKRILDGFDWVTFFNDK